MIYALRPQIVAAALDRLRSRRTHQLFSGYLHLVQLANQTNQAGTRHPNRLEPRFKEFFDRYFRVPDHPLGSPYIRPFISSRPTSRNLWFNENVAGSYAPSSIRPDQPFRKVVDIQGRYYALKEDHEELALKHLLYGDLLSLVDMGLVLLRDRGFKKDPPTPADVVAALGVEFGGTSSWKPRWASVEPPSTGDDESWFTELDPGVTPTESATPSGRVTADPVRVLSASDLRPQNESVDPHPCLRRLTVQGLLSFGERAEFEFGKLNILVGSNGAGKSNLIDCIRVLRSTADEHESIQRVFKPTLSEWLYKGADKGTAEVAEIEADVAVEGVWLPLKHRLRVSLGDRWPVDLQESIQAVGKEAEDHYLLFAGATATIATGSGRRRREDELPDEEYDPRLSILNQKRDLAAYPEITRLQRLYSRWRIYSDWRFGRDSELRKATPITVGGGSLAETMENFASAVGALIGTSNYEKRLRPLLSELKETYQDLRTQTTRGNVALELIEGHFITGIPAERLSDGTLRFLALAAILLDPEPPSLICLEEPELGLHPDAIAMVANMIADAAERSQLIVTTHSEHFLTALQDRFDVLFAFDTGPHGSFVRRLEREAYKTWRGEHALGQLWASGEIGGVRF